MNKEEIKYYTSSDGTVTPIKEIEFTHLSNALAKKYREVFEADNKEILSTKINEINDIKEEIHRRINEFSDKLGE